MFTGDLVSVDCGVLRNKFYGDSAYTFSVGEPKEDKKMLMKVTQECLDLGVSKAVSGMRIGDVGFAV